MNKMINILAEIEGIKYTPILFRKLNKFNFDELEYALSKDATFILKIDEKNEIVLSWWVSAKRTRSYPYARIYDSLNFSGKRITIIPIFKDEGLDGDRDLLQWDTISLMSLLGIYVIISYYKDARKNSEYKNKITNQRFDVSQIKSEINKILSYQSDALHWNLEQIDKIKEISKRALESYEQISQNLNVKMHSKESAENRILEISKGKKDFMKLSRELAQKAQKRESLTIQPKESIGNTKAILTIKNYLGGYYYFTSDETEIRNNQIFLIEAKHSKKNKLPVLEDIKDGLIKMILFSNLKDVKIDNDKYNPLPILKLTTGNKFSLKNLKESEIKLIELIKKEAELNNFKIMINKEFIH